MNGKHVGEEGAMISTAAEHALRAMAFPAGNGDRPSTIPPGTGGVAEKLRATCRRLALAGKFVPGCKDVHRRGRSRRCLAPRRDARQLGDARDGTPAENWRVATLAAPPRGDRAGRRS
jgi:hypothetical protein